MAEDTTKLLIEIAADDQKAFEELIDLYQPRIFNFSYRILGKREDAQDVTQETFLRIYEKAGELAKKKELNLQAYIYRVAQNLAINEVNRRGKVVAKDDLEAEDTNVYQDPERALLLKDQINKVRKVAKTLAEGHQIVLTLRELHELDYQNIGEVMGMTRNNVGVLLMRARLKFKEAYIMGELNEDNLTEECKRMLPLISAYYDNEVTPEERKRVKQHLKDCPLCKLALDEITEASMSYRSLIPLAVPAAIKTGVLAKAGTLAGHGLSNSGTFTSASQATGTATQAAATITKTGMSLVAKIALGIGTAAIVVSGAATVIIGPAHIKDKIVQLFSGTGTVAKEERVSKIAFVRFGDIWVVDLDEEGKHVLNTEKKLTNTDDADDSNPVWSHDGKKIAFISKLAGPGPIMPEVHIINADGTKVATLVNKESAIDFTDSLKYLRWSEADSALYFGAGYQYPSFSLCEVNVKTKKIIEMPTGMQLGFDVVGDKYVMAVDLSGNNGIRGELALYPGEEKYRMTTIVDKANDSPTNRLFSDPECSPDGKRVVVCEGWGGNESPLYIVDINKRSNTKLINGAWQHPTWSQDGKAIAMEKIISGAGRPENQKPEVWRVNDNGKGLDKLLDNASSPSWSPATYIKKKPKPQPDPEAVDITKFLPSDATVSKKLIADIDQDNYKEIIVAASTAVGVDTSSSYKSRNGIVVVIDWKGNKYVHQWEKTYLHPTAFEALEARDVNKDKKVELIVKWIYGAHAMQMYLYQFDGYAYRPLNAVNQEGKSMEVFSSSTPRFEFKDRDGDGIDELLVYGRDYETGADPTRNNFINVYKWQNNEYKYVDRDYETIK
ncbi:MAG: sigma-70 family RNA polymerase sigma factor [Actinomycetota bacterium]